MIDLQIKRLVDYGVNKGLIGEADRIWATNEILDALHLSEYTEPDCKADSADLEEILKGLLEMCIRDRLRTYHCNRPSG